MPNGSQELLVCRWQLRVKPITSRVLNAHTVAVLYLHQTMLHLMEFCTANTTFLSFSRKREAITIWSNLHRWSVKQQPPIWILQRSSHKLPICGFVESIFPLLSSLPQCVLLWSSQFRDGKQKRKLARVSSSSCWAKLFVC